MIENNLIIIFISVQFMKGCNFGLIHGESNSLPLEQAQVGATTEPEDVQTLIIRAVSEVVLGKRLILRSGDEWRDGLRVLIP